MKDDGVTFEAEPAGALSELDPVVVTLSVDEPWSAVALWAWFGLLLGMVILTQLVYGAYRAELGNFSDESSHFMNALLLRDYLTHGLAQPPLAFAENYYLSYPKIAPLMWPPFFHAALGLFLLPGWAPHPAALVFMALITALTAFRLSRIARLIGPPLAAAVVPMLFLFTPVIINLNSAVMVDIALVALGLEAAWWLARYFVSGERRHAILFGVFATGCCLTKGNGVGITLLPGLLMLATGRLHTLRSRGLYVAAAMVALIAAPFVYISYRLCDAMGDFTGTGAGVAVTRAQYFALFLWHQLTPVPFVLALIGAASAVHRAWTETPSLRVVVPAALVALAAANVLFHVVLPLEYYSGRYVATSIAPLLALMPLGVMVLLRALRYPGRQEPAIAAVLAVAVFSVFVLHPAAATRRPLGYSRVADMLVASKALAGGRVLVISDEAGEGALVSEIAMRRPSPVPMIIRGSKLLVDGDWMGGNLQTLFGSPSESLKHFEDLHIDYVIFDDSPEAREMPYWAHVHSVLQIAGDRLAPAFATAVNPESGPTRALSVYRVTHQTPGPPVKLRVNLRYSLGKFLER